MINKKYHVISFWENFQISEKISAKNRRDAIKKALPKIRKKASYMLTDYKEFYGGEIEVQVWDENNKLTLYYVKLGTRGGIEKIR